MINNLSKRASRKNSRDREINLIRDSNFTFQITKEDTIEFTEWMENDIRTFLDRFWEFKKASKILESSVDLGNMTILELPYVIGKQLDLVKECVDQMLSTTDFGDNGSFRANRFGSGVGETEKISEVSTRKEERSEVEESKDLAREKGSLIISPEGEKDLESDPSQESSYDKLLRFCEKEGISIEEVEQILKNERRSKIKELDLVVKTEIPDFASSIGKGDPLMGNHTIITYGETQQDFLISNFEGYYLFINEVLIKEHKFTSDYQSFEDVIFWRKNFWLYSHSRGVILRKGMDSFEPVIFTEIEGPGIWARRILHTALQDECLIVSYFNQLQIYKVDSRFEAPVESNYPVEEGANMFLQVFGEFEDKVAFLTDTLNFCILRIIRGLNSIKLEPISKLKITGVPGRIEKGISFAICDRNDYAFVHLYEPGLKKNKASSIVVFKVLNESSLKPVAFSDIGGQDMFWFAHNFNFVRYEGDFGILSAIEFGEKPRLKTFVFDTDEKEIKEMEQLERQLDFEWVERLKAKGDLGAYGMGHDNTLILLEYR